MRFPVLFLMIIGFCPLFSGAQIVWNFREYDFGDIRQGSEAKVVFRFENKGMKPGALSQVKASCGCTTPKWSHDTIYPGKSGEIEVQYSTDRIGEFNKMVSVFWDSAAMPEVLKIRGVVFQRIDSLAQSDTTDPYVRNLLRYVIQHTHIYLQKESDHMGELKSTELKRVDFPIANFGSRIVKFTSIPQDSDEIILLMPFTDIRPGREEHITVILDGKKMGDISGPFERIVKIKTDMPGTDQILEFSVKGNFTRVFTAQELLESPKMTFDQLTWDAGKVLQGDFVEHSFGFVNEGKSKLVIYDTEAECGCTAVKPEKNEIAPGERSFIRVTFDSRGREGYQRKKVTVRTNDRNSPERVLELDTEVEKDPFHARPQAPSGN